MKSKGLFYLFAVAALGFMVATGCEPTNPVVVPQITNVTFTECNNEVGTRDITDNSVVVVFTNSGVNITHYGLVVSCDFDTVIITQIFENGVLTITERGEPNYANCICHTDVSYTISGISESNVNKIVINGNVVWTAGEQPPQPSNPLVGLWYSQEPYIGLVPYIEFTADNRFLHHFLFENWNYNLICDTLILTNPVNNQKSKFMLSFVNENEIIIYNFLNGIITADVKNIHFIRQQTQPISNGNVLMLKVDYLTNTFEGGYEFAFDNVPNSFTIRREYQSPGDFGYIKFFYDEINEMLFYGTIIWMGEGQIYFPQNILPASAFDFTFLDNIVFPNDFENIGAYPPTNSDYTNVWLSVENLAKVRDYLIANPEQTVKIFLYTPCVGIGDPAHWDWILFLKK